MIKTADRAAALSRSDTARRLRAPEARRFFGPPPVLSPAIERDYLTPWSADAAETRFLERFKALLRE